MGPFPRFVYAIKHNPTGRVYVGSSKDPEERMRSHLWALRRRAHIVADMQADFDTYGDDYSCFILDTIPDIHEKDREYEWMEHYGSHIRGKGYNYKDRCKKMGEVKL
jgi:hypothetical protein